MPATEPTKESPDIQTGTMTALIEQGHARMRLPFWNEFAYAAPRETGPWADVYDVGAGIGGGAPVPVLIGMCDEDNRWEPCDGA
jgi:hypothetical protein